MAQDASSADGDGLTVIAVEPVDGERVVYDIEVESDHSFIVNGAVVHNCATCRSLDQMVFAPDKGPRPPIHINDRCTTIPVLDDEYAKYMQGATRPAVRDGEVEHVPGTESYYVWLKKQPAAFIDETLGPTRGKLFRDGGLSAKRFAQLMLDRNWKPLTLKELMALEPNAWRRAGL